MLVVALYRLVGKYGHQHYSEPLAYLQVEDEMVLRWRELHRESVRLGTKFYGTHIGEFPYVSVRDVSSCQTKNCFVEIDFYRDGVNITVPNYGSKMGLKRPWQRDWSLENTLEQNIWASVPLLDAP